MHSCPFSSTRQNDKRCRPTSSRRRSSASAPTRVGPREKERCSPRTAEGVSSERSSDERLFPQPANRSSRAGYRRHPRDRAKARSDFAPEAPARSPHADGAWTAGETRDAFRPPAHHRALASQGTDDAKSVTSWTDGSFPSWRSRRIDRSASKPLGVSETKEIWANPVGKPCCLRSSKLGSKRRLRIVFPSNRNPVIWLSLRASRTKTRDCRYGEMVVKIAPEYSVGFERSIVVLPIDEQQEAGTLDRSRGEDHFPRFDRETATVETLRSYGAEPSARLQRELANVAPSQISGPLSSSMSVRSSVAIFRLSNGGHLARRGTKAALAPAVLPRSDIEVSRHEGDHGAAPSALASALRRQRRQDGGSRSLGVWEGIDRGRVCENQTREADIVVVGAGTAGLLIAVLLSAARTNCIFTLVASFRRRGSRKGSHVVVVESGGEQQAEDRHPLNEVI
jgi:hypothetical protein